MGFLQFVQSDKMQNFVRYAYGWGASIVLIGALFKLQHWPNAGIMLTIGLSTEAFIFFLSVWEHVHKEPKWEKVYPQLAPDYDAEMEEGQAFGTLSGGLAATEKMLKEAKFGPKLLEDLSSSLHGLKDNVSKISSAVDASIATSEYGQKVKEASKNLGDLNRSYSEAIDAMSVFSNGKDSAKAYHEQMQAVTKNLSSLNAVYELELQDAQSHLKSMNMFYGNISQALSKLIDATDDTIVYKDEVKKLTKNISALNTVYGNMLSAMGAVQR